MLTSSHVESLKTSLLRLDPTGEDGFEGLMATALTEITGIPFRVAASGSQFGSDGSSAKDDDSVHFECKLYKDRIPRKEILSKLVELPLRSAHVEAWFLCGTAAVSAQVARDVQEVGRRLGIATFILDWTGALPPLAVALAMETDATRRFLPADAVGSAASALDAVRSTAGFEASAERLRRSLLEPLVGTELARRANAAWLLQTFGSRQRATRAFGEPLSPLDAEGGTARLRADLVARVGPFLTGDQAGTTLCVLGDEGVGKSWLVAQSWFSVERRPLMVVLSPRNAQAVAGSDDCEDVVASKLPAQTDGPVNDAVASGWRRKLGRWRDLGRPNHPRLVVVIDGVNQRPQTDWARVIDVFGDTLNAIGGRLVVTVRTAYYETKLKPRFAMPVEELRVPEWTDVERDEILVEHGIDHAGLRLDQDGHATVGRALLNPRLLGVAVRLLKGRTIEHIEELNLNHLLFEHLRTRAAESRDPEPAQDSVRRLRDLAQKVLDRLRGGTIDDVTVFDGNDLRTVADGRYFVPVDGDVTRYALLSDGLVLAFGFLVLDRLRTAQRNGRDLAAELAVAVDPLTALDQTAAVLMAALTCACIDDTQRDEVVAALLCAFAELQNPNRDDLKAFKRLARKRTLAFLEAARRLCLAGWNQPNVDWIEAALLSSKADGEAWHGIQAAIRRWLACRSLSPESDARSPLSTEEAAKRTEEVRKDLNSLTSRERLLLEGMEETEGDISTLSRLAFALLAGGRIAPFASSLVRWTLASVVNHYQGWPYHELRHVVTLNRADWSAARAELRRECRALRGAGASEVGTWAAIELLRATGNPDDARESAELAATISESQPTSWRRIEQYCSTDPCDPSAPKASNVTDTARRYERVDVHELYSGSWKGAGEHFLEMARPGIARFEPQVAVEKHRELIEDVLKRRGPPLIRGLSVLLPLNALLTSEKALALANEREDWQCASGDLPNGDRWWVSQKRLLLAFPRLSGEEQLRALLGATVGDDVLRSLLKVMKPVDEEVFEELFDAACADKEARRQYFLLVFAKGSGTHISQRVREHLATLMTSEVASVRMSAMERAFGLQDEQLMRIVVDSGWRAELAEGSRGYERAYGSAILVEGALRGWIPVDVALGRMSPEHYGWAARRLGSVAARKVVRIVDASIRAALSLTAEDKLPRIEYDRRPEDQVESLPWRLAEAELELKTQSAAEVLKRPSGRDGAFEEHQKRCHQAFETFRRRMREEGAWIVVQDLDMGEFEAIVNADRETADGWGRLFLRLGAAGTRNVHNVVLKLAYALRQRRPKQVVELLRCVDGATAPIGHTVGRARVPLEVMVAWSTAGSEPGREWCYERLDLARNDHEIATEVLAALLERQEATLGGFIRERLNGDEPEGIARGLLVAGFSSQGSEGERALNAYEGTKGFLGEAHRAARYAYERDGWARQWFKKMCEAGQDGDFWRYSVLFTKIVDGRFAVWGSEYERTGEPMRLFEWSVNEELDRRIRKWQKAREETLFGARKPPDVFLPKVARMPGDVVDRETL